VPFDASEAALRGCLYFQSSNYPAGGGQSKLGWQGGAGAAEILLKVCIWFMGVPSDSPSCSKSFVASGARLPEAGQTLGMHIEKVHRECPDAADPGEKTAYEHLVGLRGPILLA
jgi:hypothetical protein